MTSAILVLALLASPGDSAAGSSTPWILDFSATWCGPCQTMRPVVRELERQGYPVRGIDIDKNRRLADRYQVESVPTFVIVDPDGRELARTAGVQRASELARLYQKAQAKLDQSEATELLARSDELDRTIIRGQEPDEPDEFVESELEDSATTGERFHPWETVVRIKVLNHLSRPRPSVGFGSGTIIRSTPEESIILTCAHIFHIEGMGRRIPPSKFPLKVVVDLFDGQLRDSNTPNRTPYVRTAEADIPAEVIDYDFIGDVGLIRIRPGRQLPYSMVVPPGWTPKKGMKLNTVGCSEGRDATAWTTRVTTPLIRFQPKSGESRSYEGTECSHPPLQGRSGGGLFTMDGILAGVCDFNDGPYGHGLYASPRTIHRLLDRHNLQICYATEENMRGPDASAIARNDPPRAPKVRAQSPQAVDGQVMPIPPPEMLGVSLPEVPESNELAELLHGHSGPNDDPEEIERRYRWRAAPATTLQLAEQSTRPADHDSDHSDRPRTARMETDQAAAGNDLFLDVPDFESFRRAQPASSSQDSQNSSDDDRWRAAPDTARLPDRLGRQRD